VGWGREGGWCGCDPRCVVWVVLVVGHRSHRRGGARVAGCGGRATTSTVESDPQGGRGWVGCVVAACARLCARRWLAKSVPPRQPQLRVDARPATVEAADSLTPACPRAQESLETKGVRGWWLASQRGGGCVGGGVV
jgi:hypothetical protein